MLLYCTEGYPGFPRQIPGVGEVTTVDDEAVVSYRWVPFDDPIPKALMDQSFDADDVQSLRNIRFSTKWLFEISERSFRQTVSNRPEVPI